MIRSEQSVDKNVVKIKKNGRTLIKIDKSIIPKEIESLKKKWRWI